MESVCANTAVSDVPW